MRSIAQLFDQAAFHHQSGDLAMAENLYRQLLEADPGHVDAWHLLGLIAVQVGRHDVAVEYIGQALRLKPECAEAHSNLGFVLYKQGKLAEAEACFRQALCLQPGYADAYINLGNVLRDQGKLDEAEAVYQEALRLKPGCAEAYNNLGNVPLDQGKLAEAEACFRQALCLQPGYADAHNNLGNALREQGKLDEAEASYREALRLKPGFAEAYNNLGIALGDQGKLAEGEASYRQALRLKLDYAEAHLNLSLHLLRQGNFAEGWPEYEWRRSTRDNLRDPLPPPSWDGSPLDGQSVLVQTEQGAGDAFQFIRYARLVKAKGGRVVLQCQAALARILATCPDLDQVVAAGTPLPPFPLTAPLLSLPMLCRTTLETIPAEVPYLAVDAARVQTWRTLLAALPGFKVGICWQGSPKLKRDRLRSVPLAVFGPLAKVPGVCLFALQRGPGLEQIGQQRKHLSIVDLPGRSEDPAESWLDTAAMIQALDLVISVDTAVVHLAGALGAPVWVALPFMPDWRWLVDWEDSPWYPSMRLFHQQRPGDWPEAFQRIAMALHDLVATREAAAKPLY
jgi:tetratricopeptide (TPR) repeat protein